MQKTTAQSHVFCQRHGGRTGNPSKGIEPEASGKSGGDKDGVGNGSKDGFT